MSAKEKEKAVAVTDKKDLNINKADFIQVNQGKFRDFY